MLLAGSLWHKDSWLHARKGSIRGGFHARKGPIIGANENAGTLRLPASSSSYWGHFLPFPGCLWIKVASRKNPLGATILNTRLFPCKRGITSHLNLVLYGIRELAYQPNTVTSLECSLHHSARQGVSRLTPDIPVVCPSQDSADQLCSDLIQFLIVQNTLQQIQASSNKNIMSLSCCTV